ncbi:MAG: hypothetical protein JJT78_16970 [Leptospira sp.]|nr:hypothetical protein [Leptospira sp.]
MNGIDLEQKFRKSSIRLDKNLASFYSALSAVLIFLLSYNILRSYKDSLFMAFIFAFGTLMFSCVSRGLWQHNATILLYSIVIIALRKDNNKWTVYAISPLVFSYLVRPTSLLPILVLLPILIYSNRSRWLIIIAQLILIASMFLCINYSLFNTWNHPYYDFTKISHMKHFWEASIGNLLSPSRGLFIYSPIFLFSFLGIYFKYKVEKLRAFELGMIFIIFIHWISISKNENWWGGHSYGYRLFSDMIPFLSYFYIFFWKYNSIKLFKYIFYISIFISIAINSIGAIRIESYLWNVTPNNIDTNPSRNWDWKDPPFLR